MCRISKINDDAASLRLQSDMRQYGGLLMLTGFCAVVQPLTNISSKISPEGNTVTGVEEIDFWSLFGSFCLFTIGCSSVIVGFLVAVNDWANKHVMIALIALTQTAFIPYVTDMVSVGRAMMDTPNAFLVTNGRAGSVELNQTDLHFIGSMGLAGIFSYGFGLVGSIAFMQFGLLAFVSENGRQRNYFYYKGRLRLYSILLVIAGLSQLLLGSYTIEELERMDDEFGRFKDAYIQVAMYTITQPAFALIVGILQFLNGSWGFLLSFDFDLGGAWEHRIFWLSMALQWLLTLLIQDIAQIAYLPGGTGAAAGPTLACLSFGLHLMPAFLDYKMKATFRNVPIGYYETIYESTDDEEAGEASPSNGVRSIAGSNEAVGSMVSSPQSGSPPSTTAGGAATGASYPGDYQPRGDIAQPSPSADNAASQPATYPPPYSGGYGQGGNAPHPGPSSTSNEAGRNPIYSTGYRQGVAVPSTQTATAAPTNDTIPYNRNYQQQQVPATNTAIPQYHQTGLQQQQRPSQPPPTYNSSTGYQQNRGGNPSYEF